MLPPESRGLTVRETAQLLRVSPTKILAWIKRGELKAVNVAAYLCGRPRWVITPSALADFERRRACATATPKQTRRPRRTTPDYFPEFSD